MAFDLSDEELRATRRMKGLVKEDEVEIDELRDWIKHNLNVSDEFKDFILKDIEDIPKEMKLDNKMILNIFERNIFSYTLVRVSHLNVNIHEKNIEKFFKNLGDELLIK